MKIQHSQRTTPRFLPGWCLVVFLVLLGMQPAYAQETVSFQGRLTTSDGRPVNDGSYTVQFQLFAQETGGSPQWEESHAVTTDDGVFSTLLGTETPLDLDAFETMPYLALTADGVAMEPRIPLTAVPYAMKSYRLDEQALVPGQNVTITRREDGALQIGSTGGSGSGLSSVATDATMEGNGTSANPLGLADGSVTGEKLSNNALLAGANVDIVRRGNGSWEISATGGGGGLTQVASDATLAGNGTTGSPLQLADGAVTGAKLANNALVAGTNVTITRQAGGAFEVASTGGGLAQVTSNATLTGEGTAGAPLQVSVPLVLTNPGNGTVLEAHNGTGTTGHLGSSDAGAYGEHSQGHRGLLGSEFSGVFGLHGNGNVGELGSSNYGAYGFSNTAAGVYGGHNSGTIGMLGSGNHGVYGEHGNGSFGYLGGGYGVYGESSDGSIGILGGGAGVYGSHASNGNWGELGGGTYAVTGHHGNGNTGVLGGSTYGVYGEGSSSGDAGGFLGDVTILGNLAKSSGSFKIDHPLDPEGKYLSHSFVESPDMMNVYNGNVTTDANGEAVVTLPDYFEALNRDFRYQLTAIGAPGPNLYIAEKIAGNTFKIAGGEPGMEVSWQVTGIRQDAWAEENRIVVEEDKPAKERGFYLHPTLFGQPEERSLLWAHDPEGMRTIQERPARLEEKQREMEAERARIEQERHRVPEQR